jgi:hypothetical protein
VPQATHRTVTQQDIERFRRRAQECLAEAELTSQPSVRQQRAETALAYERMAARAERLLAGG